MICLNNELLIWVGLFLIYSIAGWLIEIVCCGVIEKKFVDRGFLIGPYCPIYGFSAVAMLFLLEQYQSDALVLFILSAIICSVAEYVTSYVMEKLFKARWWDYSHKMLNVDGRICLSNSILFGMLGLFLIYIVNPFILAYIKEIPIYIYLPICSIFLIAFIIDIITSLNIICKLKQTTKKVKEEAMRKDATEEITKKVREILTHQFFSSRLLRAFPNIKLGFERKKYK